MILKRVSRHTCVQCSLPPGWLSFVFSCSPPFPSGITCSKAWLGALSALLCSDECAKFHTCPLRAFLSDASGGKQKGLLWVSVKDHRHCRRFPEHVHRPAAAGYVWLGGYYKASYFYLFIFSSSHISDEF